MKKQQEAMIGTLGPPKWEYKIVSMHQHYALNEEAFSALGRDGWELVGLEGQFAYFKRWSDK